MQPSFIRGPAM